MKGGDSVSENQQKTPESISAFAYESAMMHKDADVERAHKTTLWVCITFVLIVVIFVAAYTVRTTIWLETINKMIAVIVELSQDAASIPAT